MAQIVYRGNLGSSSFPFIAENKGRSIVIRQFDQNFVPNIMSAEDLDKDMGIPQAYYCHNVIATGYGFQSISYDSKAGSVSPTEDKFLKAFSIRDANENRAYLSFTSDGRVFVAIAPFYVWTETFSGTHNAAALTGKEIYVAHVAGTSYIYAATLGCMEYDFGTNTLVDVTLSGLSVSAIYGIVASQGYLVAWGKTNVAWSSTIDPTDFVPSLATGAGGGSVEGAAGAITFCAEHNLGFIVYTTANAVAALYSGNARFPFNFNPIVSAGGCSTQDLVSVSGSNAVHQAYTTSGLQEISTRGATVILPEITDFISGSYFEDFDENALQFDRLRLANPMKKKLTVVADRYLVMSYGVTELTHALMYDLALKRFGKFKITHVDCFEYQNLTSVVDETPRECIGFLQKDGNILVVNMSNYNSFGNGILIVGKFQHIRQRLLQLQMADVENIERTAEFNLYNLVSLNGKDYASKDVMFELERYGNSRRYSDSKVGINHSLLFKGSFNLSSLVLYYNVHGRR